MPDDKVKLFMDKVSDYDVDDAVLHEAEKHFAKEIKLLEYTAEEIGDKVVDAAKNLGKPKQNKKPMDGTTPISLNEQIENQLRSTEPNAVNTLMKPDLPSVEKKSNFFDGVRVNVSIEDVEFRKKMNKGVTLSTGIDFFDKTAGFSAKKVFENSRTSFKGGVEYNPIKQSGKVKFNYNTLEYKLSSNVYLNKDNCGINASCLKQLSSKSSVNAGVSVFHSDAAFNVNYNKILPDKTKISLGAYGSTANKEVGVTARIRVW